MSSYYYVGLLALMALKWVPFMSSQPSHSQPKEMQCEGVMEVRGSIPGISDDNGKPFDVFAGNVTYSLTMNGDLNLVSATPNWQCKLVSPPSNSTSKMRTLQNRFSSAQLACNVEKLEIESQWVTQWTQVSFSGLLYVSVTAHDGICASPPFLLKTSTCNYLATTDGGLNSSSTCNWKTVDHPKHFGDDQGEDNGGQ